MAECPCLNRSATASLVKLSSSTMAAPWELLMIGSLLATPAGLATETDTSGEA